ncbi:MAG: efflux transporter outer membrane subunit [bacterium]
MGRTKKLAQGGLVVSVSALVLLSGCKAVGPDYAQPELALPAGWSSPLPPPSADQVELARWWGQFNDSTLSGLVERALAGSKDLQLAQARVREARAARGVVAANDKPSVNAGGGYERFTQSENTGSIPQGDYGSGRDLYQGGFDASWELDVFGRVRRQVEAADADVASAEWGLRDVRVSLVAEVARNYVDLRTFQERLVIAAQNVQTQKETVVLTENRLRAGLTSELDVTRARSQLATTQAIIPGLVTGARQAMYILSVLTGQSPGALVSELELAGPIPGVPAGLPVGVPAEVVRRRADVRQAERELAGATARIGVATADLYPSFSIKGAIGLASSQVGTFFEGNSRYWSIAPGVSWNVLDFGRTRGLINVQEARVAGALAVYEQSVLVALREVDTAVIGLMQQQLQTASLKEAESAQARAVELATKLYREGLTDFISVLDTERNLFVLQDQAAESRGKVTLRLIELYKSLGGGWEEPAAEPGTAEPGSGAGEPGGAPTGK